MINISKLKELVEKANEFEGKARASHWEKTGEEATGQVEGGLSGGGAAFGHINMDPIKEGLFKYRKAIDNSRNKYILDDPIARLLVAVTTLEMGHTIRPQNNFVDIKIQ